jgi:Family of unknown function (DUF5719)
MSDTRREWTVGIVVAVLALIGLGMDLTGDAVEARPPKPTGERFVERSLFCPPTSADAEVGSEVTITAPAADDEVGARIEPSADPSVGIAPTSASTHVKADRAPVTITGYGSALQASEASVTSDPVNGSSAALCSPTASKNWYFPEDSSLLGFEERILIYNPFPEEAVARVLFFTPHGDVSRARLADVPVPAGESTSVRVNEFILRERILGAQVTALRGRVVAWRNITAKPEDRPHGVYSTLGGIEPSETWYLPDGAVEELIDERIAILNPAEEEVRITVSVMAGDRLIQPRKLSEITLRPRAADSFSLGDSLPKGEREAGQVSVLVQSTNGVPIFAESTLWYSGSEINGVSSELGISVPGELTMLGPPTNRADTDYVVVVNPSAEPVSVTLELWSASGDAIAPADLADIEVPGGLRRKIPIAEFTKGRPVVVELTSDAPVYAARSSYSGATGDIATLAGVPAR